MSMRARRGKRRTKHPTRCSRVVRNLYLYPHLPHLSDQLRHHENSVCVVLAHCNMALSADTWVLIGDVGWPDVCADFKEKVLTCSYVFLITDYCCDYVFRLLYNDWMNAGLFGIILRQDTWDDYNRLDSFLEKKNVQWAFELIIWATELWCSLMNAWKALRAS